MAKSINWPSQFKREVIAEDTDKRCKAIRIGRLYFDNRYWAEGEKVLIRVNHKIIRKATIVGDLTCCQINELTPEDYAAFKRALNTPEAVIKFLSETYNQPITPETEITLVTYQNEPIDLELMEVEDDPHM